MVRNLCGCDRKRFIGEDIVSGKVACKCGNLNEIKDFKTISTISNKETASYQSRKLLGR